MPPDLPGDPEDWLRQARSDLAIAKMQAEGDVMPATLAFHAQQAAEKSMKAVLVRASRPFPYSHDLAELITIFDTAGIDFPEQLKIAASLTAYAVGARYPGMAQQITNDDAKSAREIAEHVLRVVGRCCPKGTFPPLRPPSRFHP